MSWKSFVTAGLLCALASPVFAQPTLNIDLLRTGGGTPILDSNGDWQWVVTVTGEVAGPLDAELAFILEAGNGSANLESISSSNVQFDADINMPGNPTNNTAAPHWDISVPGCIPGKTCGAIGNVPFGDFDWLSGTEPSGAVRTHPSAAATDAAAGEVLAALGSINFPSAQASELLIIKTTGPVTTGNVNDPFLTTAIEVGGAYGTGATGAGRIAGLDPADPNHSLNYDIYAGSTSATVLPGDANLDGIVDVGDYNQIVLNFEGPASWTGGNFNGDSQVDVGDYNILVLNFGDTSNGLSEAEVDLTIPGPGSAPGVEGAIPEPSSIALGALAVLGCLGLFRRNR